ncbi:Gfo/Idh/MocA family oxidoreductase [Agromyces endophyticus]|uniref:Gfo/Idh/MocA family protein n=1 Tax=Agromyces sp. H17E-10 TaxID=2932244 RepID=UPI001FD228A9|nr:Gfo/Idh/MocA family oxidoreductase [Agromyces sp. H17E-10]UOQ90362.1 Gfo/Idh/MocA family oxidoreductase [Agromyces sp. H17E-10]
MTTDVIAPARTRRAGFVGGGFMAAVHSRAARAARADLVGAASSSPSRAAAAAERLGLGAGYDSFEALLADPDIEVVHICTPNTTHAAFARAALEAGKHVICEKPLATTTADAEALADLAAERGLVAAVPFVYRFHPMAREARARVAAGETGRLLSVHGAYLQDWLATPRDDDWRVDTALGGPSRAFADIGSHLVDLVEFVAGERIVRLAASTRTVYAERADHAAIETEDLVALVVELSSGALGTLLVSQVAPGRKNALSIELAGTDASVRFEQERPDTLWIGRTEASSIVERDPARLAADAARLSLVPAGHPMGYQDAFNAFVADAYAAIDGARPEGLPTFADGLRAARVTEAVLASAERHDWVEVAA